MAERTEIPWTHGTFNPWIGCTKISPECMHCYADEQNAFRKWNGGTWGPGAPRRITSHSYWKQPFKWDRDAALAGERRRVFAASLADIFDDEAPAWPAERAGGYQSARDAFFRGVVAITPNIDWIVLTKRFDNAARYLTDLWGTHPWPNVWVVFSAGTQKRHDEAVWAMTSFVATVKGISAEPMLEPVRFNLGAIDWLIIGGESGREARLFDMGWIDPVLEARKHSNIALFVKQAGSNAEVPQGCDDCDRCISGQPCALAYNVGMDTKDRKGGNPGEWPRRYRVREFPEFATRPARQ